MLYEESRLVSLTAPYVSGFLAFREAPFLVDAVQRLQEKAPDLMPQAGASSQCRGKPLQALQSPLPWASLVSRGQPAH